MHHSEQEAQSRDDQQQPTPFMRLAAILITISIPVLLVLGSARLVMTPVFLHFEYGRPGFPQDFYGFTTEDRLRYAPLALEYLIQERDIGFLGDQRLADGRFMYNTRELHHMRDVQAVTRIAFRILGISGFLALCSVAILTRSAGGPRLLHFAILRGGLLTLGLIAAVVIIALVNWDFFFTGFHQIFFTEGTWRFEYSDTLIRLFPEQFWFDAALVVGGLAVGGAVVLIIAMRLVQEGDIRRSST